MELMTSAMPQELPMETIAPVSQAMQMVLTTLAAEADVAWHDPKRPDLATCMASTRVQTLVFGWLAHPDARVEPLAPMAATVGVAVSPPAIDQRFTVATASLRRTVLLGRVPQGSASDPVAIPIRQRFAGVRVHDSTTIVLPEVLADHAQGGGGQTETHTAAARTCGLQLDLLSGAYTQRDRADGRAADQRVPRTHAPLPPGSLRLAARGFLDLAVLAARDASGAADRSKRTARITLRAGTQPPQALLVFIQDLGPWAPWEGTVWVGQDQPVQARLLVQAAPQEVADHPRVRGDHGAGRAALAPGLGPDAPPPWPWPPGPSASPTCPPPC
jgi:hypothetical protein